MKRRKKRRMTKRRITKKEGRAFKRRWAAINRAEIHELRWMSLEEKFKQLAALMASSKQLGWNEALAAEEDEVRERWNRLRKAYGV